MGYRKVIVLVLSLILANIAYWSASTTRAQVDDPGYIPTLDIPDPDIDNYLSGIDTTVFDHAYETMSRFQDHADRNLGVISGTRYDPQPGGLFGAYPEGRIEYHPWHFANDGRDFFDGAFDWWDDSDVLTGWLTPECDQPGASSDCEWESYVRFTECFEARLVLPFCPHCSPGTVRTSSSCSRRRNSGWIWEFWWPEFTIELNNFGIAALNPVDFALGISLDVPSLYWRYENIFLDFWLPFWLDPGRIGWTFDDAGIPDGLRNYPHMGQDTFAGFLPGDHNTHENAHVYLSNVNHATTIERNLAHGHWDLRWHEGSWDTCWPSLFWYNGYRKGNTRCFYNVLNERGPVMAAWTEELGHQIFWKIPEASDIKSPDWFGASMPLDMDDDIFLTDYSCASYRVDTWDDPYGDLFDALGVLPNSISPLDRICYRGGGQLYPLIGSVAGNFSTLTSGAYLVRRAIEVMADPVNPALEARIPLFADRNLDSDGDVQDSIDKLQRIYPLPSRCFRMNQVDDHFFSNISDAGRGQIYPKDGFGDDNLGSQRFAYWNKRMACTCEYRGVAYHEDEASNDPRSYIFGWGCTRYPLVANLAVAGENSKTGYGDLTDMEIWGFEPLDFPGSFDLDPWAEAASRKYPFPRTIDN